MQPLGFFTAVTYSDQKHALLNAVEDYFFWGNQKAYVVTVLTSANKSTELTPPIEEVVLCKSESHSLVNIIRAISYATLVVPAIMLTTKAILRACHNFQLVDPAETLEDGGNFRATQLFDTRVYTIDSILRELGNSGAVDKIARGETDLPGVTYEDGFFKLDLFPDYRFKLYEKEFDSAKNILKSSIEMEQYYEKLVSAKIYSLAHPNFQKIAATKKQIVSPFASDKGSRVYEVIIETIIK